MFKDERTLVATVAIETEIVGALFRHKAFCTVRVVAVTARHFTFLDRMMRILPCFGFKGQRPAAAAAGPAPAGRPKR